MFKKALIVIRENQIERPKQFARLLWPDSEGWQRVHKVGHGASRGAMMSFAAGGLLGKLRCQGYIVGGYPDRPALLTDKGKEQINKSN